MEISKYSRLYDLDDGYVLFNTINKCLVKVNKEYIIDKQIVDNIPGEYFDALTEMGFFVSDVDVEERLNVILGRDNKLIISIEVGLACNMRCPYCYQGIEKKNMNILPPDCISYLLNYLELVSSVWDYSEVVLKVLGGEPTIMWDIARNVIIATADFCKANGKKFSLMIDTNGVLIDSILELPKFDLLQLTIPLTNKECHDKTRKLVNGKGSYDLIISNLNRIHDLRSDVRLVLRHNTDSDNMNLFSDYLDDLKNKLAFSPIIDISYTTELGNNGFSNALEYKDFIAWKSNEAIDILAEKDMPIMVSPLMSYDKCQYRSRYSIKLFSDGTIGGCAMDFFNNHRLKLSEVCNNISKLVEMSDNHEEYIKCKHCKSFFLCGGGYNLPCIKSLPIKQCDADGAYILDLEQFIRKYLYYKGKGKEGLFIGFNNNISIR